MNILKVIISASIVIMIFEKLNSKYDFFKDIRSKIKNLEEKATEISQRAKQKA